MSHTLYLRYTLDHHLVELLTRVPDTPAVAGHAVPGAVTFADGAALRVAPADGWPQDVMGFRTPGDAAITATNPLGEALLTRIADTFEGWRVVYALVRGGEVLAHRPPYRCPVCGLQTLTSRASYEICAMCFWEDDGWEDRFPDAISGPNGCTVADARQGHWRGVGTKEGPRCYSAQLPDFSPEDFAEAAVHLLTTQVFRHKDRTAVRQAVRRLSLTPERRARALAAAFDGNGRQRDLDLILRHLDVTAEVLIRRTAEDGDAALAERAEALGVDVSAVLGGRAPLLEAARLLDLPSPRRPTADEVWRLQDEGRWEAVAALAAVGVLPDESRAELRSWIQDLFDDDWRDWVHVEDGVEARLAFRWCTTEAERAQIRARLRRAREEDADGDDDWAYAEAAKIIEAEG